MTRQSLMLIIVIAALGVIVAACASAPTPAPTAAPPTAVPATTAPQPTIAPTTSAQPSAAATKASANAAQNIPADHAGRAQCLVCHATGVGGAPKPPASPDHTAFKDDVAFCTQCHQMTK